VKIPPLPHLILLFFLGGVFLHFLLAGARTFARSGISDERGAGYAQISFVFGRKVRGLSRADRHVLAQVQSIRA